MMNGGVQRVRGRMLIPLVLVLLTVVLIASPLSIAAGTTSPNGMVVGWGFDDFGATDIPANLSDVTAISAGGFHSLGVTPV